MSTTVSSSSARAVSSATSPRRSPCRGCPWARRRAARAGRWRRPRDRDALCSPPESWDGRCRSRRASPTRSSSCGARGAPGGLSPAGERRLDVLLRGQRRDQVELLEDETDRPQSQAASSPSPMRARSRPSNRGGRRRPVERAEQLQQRGLARTGGPAITRNSPRPDLSSTPSTSASGRRRGRTSSGRSEAHGSPQSMLRRCFGGAQAGGGQAAGHRRWPPSKRGRRRAPQPDVAGAFEETSRAEGLT